MLKIFHMIVICKLEKKLFMFSEICFQMEQKNRPKIYKNNIVFSLILIVWLFIEFPIVIEIYSSILQIKNPFKLPIFQPPQNIKKKKGYTIIFRFNRFYNYN